MTDRLYHPDPYLLEFDAAVVARREHEARPAVVLDRTAFYAESGGQPWDTGTLGDARVVAVFEDGPDVLHVLDRPLAGERVHGRVDADRRRDHMQQHHGQHLLSKAFVEVARAETVAFHLGSEVTTIDLDRLVGDEQARSAERRANEVAWEARPVRVSMLTAAQARAEGLEPPEGVGAGVRVVEAEGFDRQPCGGTHPRTTAEVGVIVVTTLERYKGGTRVSFVCGHRALAAVARQLGVLNRLVSTLSAPLEDLVAAAQKAKDDLVESARRAKALLERALEGEARRLLAEARGDGPAPTPDAPSLVVAAFDGWSPNDLRVLATRLVALAPCVALLASRSDKAHLVFGQSEGLPHDVPSLLKAAVERLGGKGGGRGNVAQGGGERLDLLDEALAQAAAAVRTRL
ncbi:MAG TPA: alanyl-tRNA editing protein [Vicinamibacteria bacterium]|nr:alanyl-tRNA editing protein [Vicinamibacteria bacterium]